MEALTALPGIGRSTAAAILAFSTGRRHAILDGNVRRVLSRYHAVDGDPGDGAVQRTLWALAEAHTPDERVADYTQAIMDLGATVCVRSRPLCPLCPLADGCAARASGTTGRYPARRKRRRRDGESVTMLMILDDERGVLLERRPPAGIWGGLWSLPECPRDADVVDWCREHLGMAVTAQAPWSPLRHGFTHFDLEITPQPARWRADLAAVAETGERRWVRRPREAGLGLAAPVARILERLEL
jgi:A/G-specific adenine glycosylase